MIAALSAVVATFLILVGSEYLWRRRILRGEAARKTVHILTGVFVATWPFFMSFKAVQLISLLMILVVSASRYFKVFGSIHTIDRKSAGDIFFGIGVGLTALISANKWIFAAAILHLAVADGLAALVGTHIKSKQLLHIGGERRTVAGTLTFFIVSVLILVWLTLVAPSGLRELAVYIPWIALQATALEYISIWGTDNILVPVYLALVLNALR